MKYDIKKDIKKIMDSGVIFDEWIDIDDDLYHSLPGISSTSAKLLSKTSPEILKEYLYGEKDENAKISDALIFGRAIHKFLLENSMFNDSYAFGPEVKTKAERKWKVFVSEMKDSGKELLRHRDKKILNGMLLSLKRPKNAEGTNTYDGFIRNPESIREKALFTVDHKRNIILKIKVDINLSGIFLDLKSTKSAAPKEFMKSAANLRYDLQAAFYLFVARLAGMKAETFGFIAIEKEPPYAHINIPLDEEDINLANRELEVLLTDFAYCLNEDKWYGYAGIDKNTGEEPLLVVEKMPQWHRYAMEEKYNFEGV